MMNTSVLTFDELMAALHGAQRGSLNLDEMVWNWEKSRAKPVDGFAEDNWGQARRFGAFEASLTTSPAAALQLLEQTYSDAKVVTISEKGWRIAAVEIRGFGPPITATSRLKIGVGYEALVICAAFMQAHQQAQELLLRFEEVKELRGVIPAPGDWPLEQKGAKFFPVLHEHRLMAEGYGDADRALQNASTLRNEDHVILACRDRYDNFFGQPKIEHDSPSMDF